MPDRNDEINGDVALLTPGEVAVLLRVPATWVYAHQQEIPGWVRLGRYVRFRRSAVEEFLDAA